MMRKGRNLWSAIVDVVLVDISVITDSGDKRCSKRSVGEGRKSSFSGVSSADY